MLFDSQPVPRQSFDPMASFGQNVVARKGKGKGILFIAIGGAVVAALAVVAVIVLTGDKTKGADDNKLVEPTKPPEKPTPPTPTADQNTGFDLYVTPAGIAQWKLDGEARTDRLPSRIRGITPGNHSVSIDAPAGFMSETQQVVVKAGEAPKVNIVLKPIDIVGIFESTPPGATVSLIVDGKREPVGLAPTRAPLDPRHTYQVLFEKTGYVSVNRPIQFSGKAEETFNVPLEKATGVVVTDPKINKPDPKLPDPKIVKKDPKVPDPKTPDPKIAKTPDPKVPDKIPDPKVPDPKTPDPKTPDPKTVAPKGTGILMIGSKPSCEIYVDGVATGLHTPQPKMSLPAGKHRITLINNEFGINEKFSVEIKADGTEKVIKDYSDRLPK
jgi:eukaryotic-like serine/threonine-protein kinase